ncbi:MAG: molecular chaperone TorD family protein [Actinobacteria bacterium]|nr:molecular chaperone TorD family protein [Actinomycetota bacterium]
MTTENEMTTDVGMANQEALCSESQTVEALLLSRIYLYTLFHKLLGGNPSAELMEALLSNATIEILDGYAGDDPSLGNVMEFLRMLRAGEGADIAMFADEVKGEFTRLFMGPGAPEALPYESPYRTNEASYFQSNTVIVRHIFAEHGLQAKRFGHVPDDHVSLICAYLAHLGQRALEAMRVGNLAALHANLRDQQSFMATHATNWFSDLARKARTGQTARLYPQMLESLAQFAKSDAIFLGEAAYWSECLMTDAEPEAATTQVVTALQPRSDALAATEAELDTLKAIRLFGLEDCELVTII